MEDYFHYALINNLHSWHVFQNIFISCQKVIIPECLRTSVTSLWFFARCRVHSRECHTPSRTHKYIHSIKLYLFAIIPSRTHHHWKQYANEPACKDNRQPGALLYYNSHKINHMKQIWLIFLVKQVQDYSMF